MFLRFLHYNSCEGEIMKRFFKWLFSSLLVVIIFGAVALFLPLKIKDVPLKNIYKYYFREIFSNNPFYFVINKPEIINSYISEDEDKNYYLNLDFINVEIDELNAIYIDNVKYNDFTITADNLHPSISFLIIIDFENSDKKEITVNKFILNNKTFKTNKTIVVHKAIDNNIINLKKESVIAIETSYGSFFSPSRAWGSGVVFLEKETLNHFGNTIFEYYIITNYHVIRGNKNKTIFDKNSYTIYYDNMNGKISNNNIELLGYAFNKTDLAVLKVTLREQLLKALDDDQFTTYIPNTTAENEIVFAIGSPAVGDDYDFNQVKIGNVISTDALVKLKDEKEICQGGGCHALQTTAIQGKGSSGGGVFDRDGNLVGIHFAGDDEAKTSSEIPMNIVLKVIKELLNPQEENYLLKPYYQLLKEFKKAPNLSLLPYNQLH